MSTAALAKLKEQTELLDNSLENFKRAYPALREGFDLLKEQVKLVVNNWEEYLELECREKMANKNPFTVQSKFSTGHECLDEYMIRKDDLAKMNQRNFEGYLDHLKG